MPAVDGAGRAKNNALRVCRHLNIGATSGWLPYNSCMANEITLDPARSVEDMRADIVFLQAEISQIAPLLRTVAGYTWGTATQRDDFIAAAVAEGYKAATAGVCWAYGRKVMKELV